MMNDMSLHPYPKGAPTGCQISIVRPCVTAKLPVLGPWFWNLILLNLAAASCYLHGGRFWRQQVPSPLWWRNLLQVLVRELNHFKQQRKAILNIEAWQAEPLRTPYGHLSLHGPHKGQPQTEPLRPHCQC